MLRIFVSAVKLKCKRIIKPDNEVEPVEPDLTGGDRIFIEEFNKQ